MTGWRLSSAACARQIHPEVDAGSGVASGTCTRAAMSDVGDVCSPSPDATRVSGDSKWSDVESFDKPAWVPNASEGGGPPDLTNVILIGQPQSTLMTITPVSLRTVAAQYPESQLQGAVLLPRQRPYVDTDDSPCPARACTVHLLPLASCKVSLCG